jgi:hypothetical protein
MALQNPDDSTEILYGVSGDVRNEINSHVAATTGGHYADEAEIPGALIIASLRKATRLINTFLEPVYADQLPFTTTAAVPKFMDEAGSDIATYYVFRSATAKIGNLPEQKRQDYYDAYVGQPDGFLVQIADRRMLVPELTAVSPDQAQSIRTKGRAPIFDVDPIVNHEVDRRTIDDIERERR